MFIFNYCNITWKKKEIQCCSFEVLPIEDKLNDISAADSGEKWGPIRNLRGKYFEGERWRGEFGPQKTFYGRKLVKRRILETFKGKNISAYFGQKCSNCQNFDLKIRRDHKKFLWASRLWVSRR